MARFAHVPGPTIRRLSLYLRQLEAIQSTGQTTISSKQLGEALRVTDAQVRKDLAYFGQFGRPGIGYRVDDLIHQARSILGTDRLWRTVLVGVGNLGRALIAYRGLSRKGFKIVAALARDPSVVGHRVPDPNGLIVLPMADLAEVVRTEQTRIGIIAVPASEAQHVAEQMVDAGIEGILNFAPVGLRVSPNVPVATVDLAINLEQLSFQVRELRE